MSGDEAAHGPTRPTRATRPADRTWRALRIGLTGPIGCGKSTVAAWLAEEGAVVVDADRLAREVVEPGEPGFDAVVAAFGPRVVSADGGLDREALGKIVFADAAALRRLEAIVHPAVRPRILHALDEADTAGAKVVVLEAIRLVDGGYGELLDEIWLVSCTEPVQRRRLAERGVPSDVAAQRIAAQVALVGRAAAVATRVVETSGDQATTRARVTEALEAAQAARAAPRARAAGAAHGAGTGPG